MKISETYKYFDRPKFFPNVTVYYPKLSVLFLEIRSVDDIQGS